MEGPTPVSALIHAATMVAAGVYLVARLFPIYEAADNAQLTVAAIGGTTALMAAPIGMVATDIKRVLAYSTISQLGYMMLALGLGGYVAAIFHLFTNAFFKALLFLGSGSVNHATNTFDMRRMGGLRRVMPWTYATFLVASLSLTGVFPLAGFWSKDEILGDAWNEQQALFWVALAVVFLTAFYMFRAIFLTFAGISGGIEHLLVGAVPAETREALHDFEFSWGIALSSTAVALAGIGSAWLFYGARVLSAERVRLAVRPLHALLERKYFLDDLYEGVLVRGVLYRGVTSVLSWVDTYIVDGVANGVGGGLRLGSSGLRLLQTGQVQVYAALAFLGLVIAGALALALT